MKIKEKLIVSFSLLILLVGIIGFVSVSGLTKIAEPITEDIPENIAIVNEMSHLDGLAQFIRYYDEVLTQSARNYAFTQDKKWETRYRGVEPELDKIINEAIENGEAEDKIFFSSVNVANLVLVDMEYTAIEHVNNGQADKAIEILESEEYWNQKAIYEQGLRKYVDHRGSDYDEALEVSTQILVQITEDTQTRINKDTQLILILVSIGLVLAVLLGFLISQSIIGPVNILTKAARSIKRGNLNSRIDAKSNDELGLLAETFDTMRVGLKDRNELLNTLLKSFQGKFGNLATILVRKDIEKLAKKNPRILKIIPKSLSKTLKQKKKTKKRRRKK